MYPFPKVLLKMIFIFPRWDMLVSRRVPHFGDGLSVNFLHRILEKAAEALCLEKDFASAAEKVLTGSPLVVTGWLMVMLRTRCAPGLVLRPYKCPTYSWFLGPLCMWRRTVFSLSCLATLRYFEGIWNQQPETNGKYLLPKATSKFGFGRRKELRY